jgi:hypothetical protein
MTATAGEVFNAARLREIVVTGAASDLGPLLAARAAAGGRVREHAVAELAGRGAGPAAAPPARQGEPA